MRLADLFHTCFGPRTFRRTKIGPAPQALSALESRVLLDGDGDGCSVISGGYGDGSSVISGDSGGGGVGYGTGVGYGSSTGTGSGGGGGSGSSGNGAPTAYPEAPVYVVHDSIQGRYFDLAGSDPEGDSITFSIVREPAYGEIKWWDSSAGTGWYVPDPGYIGEDFFEFEVTDGNPHPGWTPNKIKVDVFVMNERPFADPDHFMVARGHTITGTVADGDSLGLDGPYDTPIFTKTSDPQKGALTWDVNTGAFTYTPYLTSSGADTFKYKLSDGYETSTEVEVTIEIIPDTVSVSAHKDFSEVKNATTYTGDPVLAGRDIGLFKVTRSGSGAALDVPVTFSGPGFTVIDAVAHFDANETETFVAVQAEYNQSVDGLRMARCTIDDPGAAAGDVRGNVSADISLYDNDTYRWKTPPSLTETGSGYYDNTGSVFDIQGDIALVIHGALAYSGDHVTWSGSWHAELYHVELTDHSLYGTAQYQFRLDPLTGNIFLEGQPTLPSLNPESVDFYNPWLKFQALAGISFTGLGSQQVIIDYKAKAEFGYSGLSTSIGVEYGGVTAGVTMNSELADVSAGLLQHIESEKYEAD